VRVLLWRARVFKTRFLTTRGGPTASAHHCSGNRRRPGVIALLIRARAAFPLLHRITNPARDNAGAGRRSRPFALYARPARLSLGCGRIPLRALSLRLGNLGTRRVEPDHRWMLDPACADDGQPLETVVMRTYASPDRGGRPQEVD
jgi:hypothetical protein